jgi:putative ABC transport system permease protein
MFQNNNGAVISRITNKSLKNNKKRNLFIITAITLTTLLLGFVFSLGMSLMESSKMEEIRFVGTTTHAAVGHPTVSQLERLRNLDYVQVVGTATAVAFVKNTPQMGKTSLDLYYFDKTEWKKLRAPAYTDIVGSYPQKENEIMVPLGVLEKLGITNPSIGMEIPIAYYTESGRSDTAINENFRLSGWFKSYALITSKDVADTILVSKEFSQKCGKTVETDGFASVVFNHSDRVLEYCQKLKQDLGLSKDQQVVPSQLYDTNKNSMRSGLIALSALIAFFILTGYLLIYNVLYISVSRDVRFYGLLKTLGTTPRQIRRIVTGQIMRLCMIGVPVGILLSLLLSLLAVPVSISKLGVVSTGAVVSFSPLIYLGAAFFALLTALLGALKPAKMAARISPVEAQKFTGINDNKSHAYRSVANGKPYKMAFRNIFRDRKRAAVVLLSLFLGVTTFITVTTLVSSMGINNYVNSMFDSDFMLKNNTLTNFETGEKQKFNNEFIEKVKSLPGVENLRTLTQGWERLDYNSQEYGQYVADFCKRNNITENLTEENIQKNFWGAIVGVDRYSLIKINHTLKKPVDVDAFERGEFALIATEHPDLFSSVHELTVSPLSLKGSRVEELSGSVKTKIPLGGFVPFSFDKGGSMAPTIVVSNSFIPRYIRNPLYRKSTSMSRRGMINKYSQSSGR